MEGLGAPFFPGVCPRRRWGPRPQGPESQNTKNSAPGAAPNTTEKPWGAVIEQKWGGRNFSGQAVPRQKGGARGQTDEKKKSKRPRPAGGLPGVPGTREKKTKRGFRGNIQGKLKQGTKGEKYHFPGGPGAGGKGEKARKKISGGRGGQGGAFSGGVGGRPGPLHSRAHCAGTLIVEKRPGGPNSVSPILFHPATTANQPDHGERERNGDWLFNDHVP